LSDTAAVRRPPPGRKAVILPAASTAVRQFAQTLTASLLLSFGIVFSLSAQSAGAPPTVVASTSWTAAIARAAGATDIHVIAPAELKHPPEYEIKPSDLEAVRDADFVIYGGYEKFAQRLAETAGSVGAVSITVYTDNVPPVFKREARKAAEAMGTVDAYLVWEKNFDTALAAMKTRIAAAYPDRRAAVHKYLQTYAEWLGFEVIGTFGPGEPSPQVVLKMVQAAPALIIDNWHNIAGKAIAESLPAAYVELINFPGRGNTKTIEDVFAYNEDQFIAAAGRRPN